MREYPSQDAGPAMCRMEHLRSNGELEWMGPRTVRQSLITGTVFIWEKAGKDLFRLIKEERNAD